MFCVKKGGDNTNIILFFLFYYPNNGYAINKKTPPEQYLRSFQLLSV